MTFFCEKICTSVDCSTPCNSAKKIEMENLSLSKSYYLRNFFWFFLQLCRMFHFLQVCKKNWSGINRKFADFEVCRLISLKLRTPQGLDTLFFINFGERCQSEIIWWKSEFKFENWNFNAQIPTIWVPLFWENIFSSNFVQL